MPMNRYQVRNEYSLADPELYKAAEKDDPEALLEGVAMAGLVGVLRQLGDLAEFAAEIFHDLHEEVMVTAARGHTLMARVQQLESEFPPIEKAFLSQTSHSTFSYNSGTEWHPNLQMSQNLITKGDLPRFVMDSYEEARGPPRLFLLDKFDIAGAGSCLKRYTDPSFYKVEASFLDMASVDVQRDKKFRKAKKKGPRWKHGETPENLPSTKLHQLFLEERVESGASDPARLMKLKRKSTASAFGSENGKSYMEKFLKTPPEDKVVHEVSIGSSPMKLPSKSTTGSGLGTQLLEASNVGPDKESVQRIRGPYPPPSLGRTIVRPPENDFVEDIVEEKTSGGSTSNTSFDDKDIAVDGEIKGEERESYHSDCDDASEIDSYMDALATMESEVETDTEFRPKKVDVGFLSRTDSDPNDEQLQSQSQYSDSQSIGNFTASDDGNSSIRKGVSSFSCSDDTASTSAEDTPSPENSKAEVTCMSSNQDSIIDMVRVDQLSEHDASDNACIEQTEIHVDKAPLGLPVDPEAIFVDDDKSGKLELSDDASSDASESLSEPTKTDEQQTDDRSEISSGPTKSEERAADESGEISSGLSKIKEQPTDDIGAISGGLTKMEEQDDMLERSDETTPRLSYAEHLADESKIEDSYVESCTVMDTTSNILEEIHEKEDSDKDVVQTKFVEDVSARNSVDTQIMSPDSVISHPEDQPSVFLLKGLGGNSNDNLSDKFDSAKIGFVSERRDLDETRDGELSRDSESDVEKSEIESRVELVEEGDIDFLSHVSESQDPPSLADDRSQSDEKENKIVHAEDEVERARNSSLPEDHAQSDERENEIVESQILEPESPRDFVLIEETNASLSSDCIPVWTSLEEKGEPEIDQLDLQPLDIPKDSDLSSQLEPVDSPDHMNNKIVRNTDFDSSELTIPTQLLEQEKVLYLEELDVGPCKVTRESSQSDLVESNETDQKSWPEPISGEASVKTPLNQDLTFPGFNLLPEVAQLNLEEMPPLPPLPPMQWRIGKLQHASVPSGRDNGQRDNHFPPIFPSIRDGNVQALNPFLPLPSMSVANSSHEDLMGNMVNSTPLLMQMPTPHLGDSQDGPLAFGQRQSLYPFEAVSATSDENENPQHAGEGEMTQPTIDHSDSRIDFIALGQTQSSTLPETCNEMPNQASPDGEGGAIQPSDGSLTPAVTPGPTSTCSSETPNGELTQSPHELSKASLEEQDHSPVVSEMIVVGPPEDFVPHPPVENGQPEHVEPTNEEETVCSSSTSELPSVDDEKPNALPSIDDEKPNGNQIPKLPRPRSPLIDAVAAHDKSKLRKVTERVRPQEEKVEERDSILEQIRMKSFNLKPAVATRPTIQGPRTNLRVAAILEKANAIRQAFAGSDDDDDDSWSDS